MPICQESLLIVLCIATRHPFSHGHRVPPIGARLESTNQDSVLNMCGRITVQNVQSQPSLTQSAKAAMSNNVRYKGKNTYVFISVVSPHMVKG